MSTGQLAGVGTVAAPAEPGVEPGGAPHRLVRSFFGEGALQSRALRLSLLVLAAQLVVLLLWSAHLYGRWSITWDYAIRYQGWWGIAHGILDPYSSSAGRFFWQDHFELVNWPIAPLSRLWPGGLWPLWIQDAMVLAGEVGALLVVADAVRRPGWSPRVPGWAALGLVTLLLVANPWIYDSVSFDFHYQSVGAACFAMLACREIVRGHLRWLALWVVLCLACGDIAGTYLVAVGAGGLLAGRAYRRRAALVAGAGLLWFLGVSGIGGNRGAGLSTHFSYLFPRTAGPGSRSGPAALARAALLHPGRIVEQVWSARVGIWAYVASTGGLGILTPFAMVPALVLFESGAARPGSLIATPYENFAAVLFLVPLGVLALGWWANQLDRGWTATHLRRRPFRWLRSRLVPVVVGALMAADAVAWGIVWIPQVSSEWLRISPAAAATLDTVSGMIPAGAEVVASQGVVGRLSGRQWCYAVKAPSLPIDVPLHTRSDYFVLAPFQGIETTTVQAQLEVIGELAGQLHARLLLHRDGVWLFRLRRGPDRASVRFSPTPTEPAWAGRTATGVAVTQGATAGWHMALRSGKPGYVLYGADFDLLPGRFTVTVTMSSSVTTRVQVWDSSSGRLLGQRYVPPTDGLRAVQDSFNVTTRTRQQLFGGWGPFTFAPYRSTPADEIEVRIWSGGAGEVSVYSVEVTPGRG